jgi:hypothetical protein
MSVSTLVLLGLAVVWAIVLLPEGLKKLSGVRSGDSIRSFNHQLSSLQRPGNRGAAAGSSNVIDMRSRTGQAATAARPVSPAVRKRRQEVLTVLGAAAVLSLLCTVAFGGPFLLLFLLAAGLLVTYVVLLYQVTNAPAPSVRTRDGYAVGAGGHRTATGEFGAVGRVPPVSARRIAN